ncbi:Uncharacterised protein [Klebsiella variicola]|nr:Uncharacterised protein [Klebsiella variicola]
MGTSVTKSAPQWFALQSPTADAGNLIVHNEQEFMIVLMFGPHTA